MLATHGVDGRTRQSQLRHTDPKLTEGTYFNQSILIAPQAEQINSVPAISRLVLNTRVEMTGSDPNGAEIVQNGRGSTGRNATQRGTEVTVDREVMAAAAEAKRFSDSPAFGTNRYGPASCDAGPCGKRAKGIEPSTFTLAT